MSERAHPATLWLSDDGFEVIAEREGCRLQAYLDSRGILTIGIGHTSAAGEPEVHEGMTITQKQADEIFRRDAARFRQECLGLVKVPVHQHEFDALASFIFNLGATQFRNSTALKRLNNRDYEGCAEAMLWWDKPPEIRSRRRGEVEQFRHARYESRIT